VRFFQHKKLPIKTGSFIILLNLAQFSLIGSVFWFEENHGENLPEECKRTKDEYNVTH
jgi:hypothetical protein